MLNNHATPRISEYTFREEILNVITHSIGLILSIIGLGVLYFQAKTHGTNIHMVSYVIFGSSLISLYLASTVYHAFSNTKLNKMLQTIDHLAVYFLIAGTYSPIILIGTNSAIGLGILGLIWSLVVINCIFRLSKYILLQRIAFINYVVMGWLIVVVFDELIMCIPTVSIYLLITGGLSYTIGIIFFLWDKLPFNHSIWHLFVLGGSTSHYFSIYYLLNI